MAEAVSEKSREMTFAEQQMLRHGWQPGKGLGRHEDGMSEPIKVKVKCDKGGVGHKLGEQFTFNWWDHVFNKASSNLSVETDQNGIMVKKLKDEEEKGMISNKRPLKANLSKNSMVYGCFVKSATLLSGQEQPEQRSSSDDSSDSEDDDQKLDLSSATNLSDAELLKVCGGRTAHKGARHGLTMSAKLARLEQQEQEFMAKYSKKATSVAPRTEATTVPATQSPGSEDGDGVHKKTKRKKNKQKTRETEIQDGARNGEMDGPEMTAESKKQKKKKKKGSKERGDTDTAETPLEAPVVEENTEDTKTKKKKKKKRLNQDMEESNKSTCQDDFKDITTTSTEEPVAKQTMDTDVKPQKALKEKKNLKKTKVENAVDSVVVNGYHEKNECEEIYEVMAEVKEQRPVDQQVCTDLDSKKKKKKKKKNCLETKEDISSLNEGATQNEESREEVPDETGDEERTDRKSKAKKRKMGGDNESGFPDGETSTMKKKKKKMRKND